MYNDAYCTRGTNDQNETLLAKESENVCVQE